MLQNHINSLESVSQCKSSLRSSSFFITLIAPHKNLILGKNSMLN